MTLLWWRVWVQLKFKVNQTLCTDLEEAGGLVERLHRAVADGEVSRVGVGDDDLQSGRVHVPQVDVGLFALAEAAHEHRPEEKKRRQQIKPQRIKGIILLLFNILQRMLLDYLAHV